MITFTKDLIKSSLSRLIRWLCHQTLWRDHWFFKSVMIKSWECSNLIMSANLWTLFCAVFDHTVPVLWNFLLEAPSCLSCLFTGSMMFAWLLLKVVAIVFNLHLWLSAVLLACSCILQLHLNNSAPTPRERFSHQDDWQKPVLVWCLGFFFILFFSIFKTKMYTGDYSTQTQKLYIKNRSL